MKYIGEDENNYNVQQTDGTSLSLPKKGINPVTFQMIEKLKGSSNAGVNTSGGFELNANAPEQRDETEKYISSDGSLITQAPGSKEVPFEMRTPLQTPKPQEVSKPIVAPPASNGDSDGRNPSPPTPPMSNSQDVTGRPAYNGPLMATETTSRMTRDSGMPLLVPEVKQLSELSGVVGKENDILSDLKAKEADLKAVELGQKEKQLTDIETARVETENQRRVEIKGQEEKVKGIMGEYRAMEVNPNSYYDNSTFGRIGAAIAVGLGAYGSVKTGAPNYAMQIIEGAIQRDIDAQKANIAKKGNEVSDQRGIYTDMFRRFGDERAAEMASKAAYLEQVSARLEKIGATAGSEQMRQSSKVQSAELSVKAKQLQIDLLAKILPSNKFETVSQTKAAETKESKLDEPTVKMLTDQNQPIAKYLKSKDLYNQFNDMKGQKVLEAATFIKFIAEALGQGSVTMEQQTSMFSTSKPQEMMEVAQRWAQGGVLKEKLMALESVIAADKNKKLAAAQSSADAIQNKVMGAYQNTAGERVSVGSYLGAKELDGIMMARKQNEASFKKGK